MQRRIMAQKFLPAIIGIFIVAMTIVSCQDEKKNVVPSIDNAQEIPTMVTRDVETFISDSGITRYHITAKIWNIYDEAKVPRWTFPYGVFLEQYDDNFKQNAKGLCDSAIYFSEKKLWRLDGEVIMVNEKRDSFLTKELFWDQRAKRLYSDTSFVRIVTEERVIEGYGFSSNERMTDYSIKKPTALFPAKNFRKSAQGDSLQKAKSPNNVVADSASVAKSASPVENAHAPTPAPPSPSGRNLKMATKNAKAIND